MRRLFLGRAACCFCLASILLLASLTGLFFRLPIVAGQVTCGTTITSDTVLTSNIFSCPGNGIVIGASGISLDCQGHIINGYLNTGSSFYGVLASRQSHVSVKNCIVTNFPTGFGIDEGLTDTLYNNTAYDNGEGFLISGEFNFVELNVAYNNVGGGFSVQGSSVYVPPGIEHLKSDISYHNGANGFDVYSPSPSLINNTAYKNGDTGFNVQYSSSASLLNNTAYENVNAGFYLLYNDFADVENNTSHHNAQGIVFRSSVTADKINFNKVYNNTDGFELDGDAPFLNSNRIAFNQVDNNSRSGFRLTYSNYNTLDSNWIRNNGAGLDGFGYAGSLVYNNFFNNTINVDPFTLCTSCSPQPNSWNVTKKNGTNIIGGPYLGGNYWGDYRGTDTNGDGFGDTQTPYVLGSPYYKTGNHTEFLGSDFLPLIQSSGCCDVAVVGVAGSPTPASLNDTISITTQIRNYGALKESFNVTVYRDGLLLGSQAVTNLAGGSGKGLNFTWRATVEGGHTIRAVASTVAGEMNMNNNIGNGQLCVFYRGDINRDRTVNIQDLSSVGSRFGARSGDPKFDPRADINGDGVINIVDLASVGSEFGRAC